MVSVTKKKDVRRETKELHKEVNSNYLTKINTYIKLVNYMDSANFLKE